ncbi:MAG: DNA-3-methyladenine glycosylase [Candidatus Thorarchaeota archaeon]
MRLPRVFYARESKIVAKDLLGKILVHKTSEGIYKGKIVETEAYFGWADPASHAYGKKITKRNIILYKNPGTAYVYLAYGTNWLLNVVAEKKGFPSAVLIRALEPLKGIGMMKRNRCTKEIINLTNGPGKITEAFGIDINHNGLDLSENDFLFIENSEETGIIVEAPRVGIRKGKEHLLRFYTKGNKFVSKITTF